MPWYPFKALLIMNVKATQNFSQPFDILSVSSHHSVKTHKELMAQDQKFSVSLINLHSGKTLQISLQTQSRFLCKWQGFTITPRILLCILIAIHQTKVLRWSREEQWLGIQLKEATQLFHVFRSTVITIYGQQAFTGGTAKRVNFRPMPKTQLCYSSKIR